MVVFEIPVTVSTPITLKVYVLDGAEAEMTNDSWEEVPVAGFGVTNTTLAEVGKPLTDRSIGFAWPLLRLIVMV